VIVKTPEREKTNKFLQPIHFGTSNCKKPQTREKTNDDDNYDDNDDDNNDDDDNDDA